jgi:hypothetical protein
MERTIKLRWRNAGGGTLRLRDRRVIKPGETFLAADDEVPRAFRDTIKLIDDVKPEKPVEAVKVTYTIKTKPGGWCDILDDRGKVVNEKSMKRNAAEELIRTLEA